MTLKQRKLNRALGEYWWDDYLRRRSGGETQEEIAKYYCTMVGKISSSCLSRWAQQRERRAG